MNFIHKNKIRDLCIFYLLFFQFLFCLLINSFTTSFKSCEKCFKSWSINIYLFKRKNYSILVTYVRYFINETNDFKQNFRKLSYSPNIQMWLGFLKAKHPEINRLERTKTLRMASFAYFPIGLPLFNYFIIEKKQKS